MANENCTLDKLETEAEQDTVVRAVLDEFDLDLIQAVTKREPGGVTKMVRHGTYFEYMIDGQGVILFDEKIAKLASIVGPLESILFPGYQMEISLKFSEATCAVFNRFFAQNDVSKWDRQVIENS